MSVSLEAGYQYPGSAGLTSDRWGDGLEFKPASKELGQMSR